MSCLYSSPEVISLEVKNLGWSSSKSPHRSGTHHAHRIAVQFNYTQMSPYVAVNKDALPNSPASAAGCIKSFRLPRQAKVSRVSSQAQYQAFVRFAVASSAALSAIALNRTCVLEPFTRRGSRFENSGFHPLVTGPAPML
jgi:hypothetical protein